MCLLTNNLKQSIILCIFKSEQQPKDSNKEREHLPANEKNELPANTPQPPLENEQAGSSETTPVILQTEPQWKYMHIPIHPAKNGLIISGSF